MMDQIYKNTAVVIALDAVLQKITLDEVSRETLALNI
jgi:hypothetical protein